MMGIMFTENLMIKTFTTSKVTFNTKIVSPSHKQKVREEERIEQGKRTLIQQTVAGVGYQSIGNNNQIG